MGGNVGTGLAAFGRVGEGDLEDSDADDSVSTAGAEAAWEGVCFACVVRPADDGLPLPLVTGVPMRALVTLPKRSIHISIAATAASGLSSSSFRSSKTCWRRGTPALTTGQSF